MTAGGRWRESRGRLLKLWGVGLAASLLVTGASAMGYLEPAQARALDLILWLQGRQPASGVVVVAIDEQAFRSMGRRQPLSRAYLAGVIRALQRSGAAVVGLDVALSVPTTPTEDGALARAIAEFSDGGVSRVVPADGAGPPSGPLAEPAFRRGVVHGTPAVPVDDDGVIRRAALLVPPDGDQPRPALGVAILGRLAGMDQVALEAALRAGGPVALPAWRPEGGWHRAGGPPVPIRAGELWRINYAGPARTFLTIPSDALLPLGEPGVEVAADNPLRGRVVLVGGTFRDGRDVYQTPHGPMPGVEVHANLVHMLATRRFVRATGWLTGLGIEAAVTLVAGVMLFAAGPRAGTLWSVALALAIGAPASYAAFHRGGYWVDFLLPVLATCLMGIGADALARRRLKDSFGRYVSPQVMAQVLADARGLRGERREVSILISDLRGFTALCETMPAEQVAACLDEYFAAMTSIVFARRGMVDDFVGDAMLAIFGAPLGDPDHALHAVETALGMERALRELNAGWEPRGLPPLRMGIGVHTGAVFAGNVGGAKLKYAVVGDPVNVAARVEALNKEFGTTILITEETRAALPDRVEARDLGEVRVKGRAHALRVHALLGLRPDAGTSGGGR